MNQGGCWIVKLRTSRLLFSSKIVSVHFNFEVHLATSRRGRQTATRTVFFRIRSRRTAWRSAWGFSMIVENKDGQKRLSIYYI